MTGELFGYKPTLLYIDYAKSNAIYNKILSRYEEIRGTDQEQEAKEKFKKWIERPHRGLCNNHRLFLKWIILNRKTETENRG